MKKICIITTHHISYNPRVLKEADTLFEKGYEVTVVTVNNHYEQSQFDELLMQTRKWLLKTINYRKEVPAEKRNWLRFSIQQKVFALLSQHTKKYGFAERALLKGYSAIKKLALAQAADLYIAHHAEALPIAYAAAKKNNAVFGFDAEDFHSGMSEAGHPSREEALIEYIEAKYLPLCKYISAASKGIGEAYAKKYNLKTPFPVLNVFPSQEITVQAPSNPVKFYWYSQVIGPNRSLEVLVDAAAKINRPFEVHLRGSFHSQAYENELKLKIDRAGLTRKFFFHSPILAEEIIQDAAKYDIGLALESDISTNRNICVTNKIFSYLMSGLAIVGSDTYGQKDIFQHFAGAVRMCRRNDSDSLAQAMTWFLEHPENLKAAKNAARFAAEQQFNWELESEKLICEVDNILNHKTQSKSFVAQEH